MFNLRVIKLEILRGETFPRRKPIWPLLRDSTFCHRGGHGGNKKNLWLTVIWLQQTKFMDFKPHLLSKLHILSTRSYVYWRKNWKSYKQNNSFRKTNFETRSTHVRSLKLKKALHGWCKPNTSKHSTFHRQTLRI